MLRLHSAPIAIFASCLVVLPAAWPVSAQELLPVVPDAPPAYIAPNVSRDEPEVAASSVAITPPPPPIDYAARFRDQLFGGLLGYGLAAALSAAITLADSGGDELEGPLATVLIAPSMVATAVWLGGLAHGGSRFEGALLGTLVGTLLTGWMITALGGWNGQRSLEDPAIVSIGLLTPVLATIAGAEIGSAISGVTRF